jgi:hypothetical protein
VGGVACNAHAIDLALCRMNPNNLEKSQEKTVIEDAIELKHLLINVNVSLLANVGALRKI